MRASRQETPTSPKLSTTRQKMSQRSAAGIARFYTLLQGDPMGRKDDDANESRRGFLGATLLAAVGARAGGGGAAAPVKPFEFDEASIASLTGRMASGSLSATALATAYLERIREIDVAGPGLRSVIELNAEALAIAGALDRERASGRVR